MWMIVQACQKYFVLFWLTVICVSLTNLLSWYLTILRTVFRQGCFQLSHSTAYQYVVAFVPMSQSPLSIASLPLTFPICKTIIKVYLDHHPFLPSCLSQYLPCLFPLSPSSSNGVSVMAVAKSRCSCAPTER